MFVTSSVVSGHTIPLNSTRDLSSMLSSDQMGQESPPLFVQYAWDLVVRLDYLEEHSRRPNSSSMANRKEGLSWNCKSSNSEEIVTVLGGEIFLCSIIVNQEHILFQISSITGLRLHTPID